MTRIRIDNGGGGRWAILVGDGVLIRLRSLSEARRRMRESADPGNPYKCRVRRWRRG